MCLTLHNYIKYENFAVSVISAHSHWWLFLLRSQVSLLGEIWFKFKLAKYCCVIQTGISTLYFAGGWLFCSFRNAITICKLRFFLYVSLSLCVCRLWVSGYRVYLLVYVASMHPLVHTLFVWFPFCLLNFQFHILLTDVFSLLLSFISIFFFLCCRCMCECVSLLSGVCGAGYHNNFKHFISRTTKFFSILLLFFFFFFLSSVQLLKILILNLNFSQTTYEKHDIAYDLYKCVNGNKFSCCLFSFSLCLK